MKQENIKQSFYTHLAEFTSLAAAGSSSVDINIETDSDFFWTKATYFADVSAAGQTQSSRVVPLCKVLITDNSNDKQLMKSALPLPLIFGTGEIPFILPTPHRFLAGGSISVAMTNFDAAQAYNLRLAFIGYKRYRKDQYYARQPRPSDPYY